MPKAGLATLTIAGSSTYDGEMDDDDDGEVVDGTDDDDGDDDNNEIGTGGR